MKDGKEREKSKKEYVKKVEKEKEWKELWSVELEMIRI